MGRRLGGARRAACAQSELNRGGQVLVGGGAREA
jgi:hypothetical protein